MPQGLSVPCPTDCSRAPVSERCCRSPSSERRWGPALEELTFNRESRGRQAIKKYGISREVDVKKGQSQGRWGGAGKLQ